MDGRSSRAAHITRRSFIRSGVAAVSLPLLLSARAKRLHLPPLQETSSGLEIIDNQTPVYPGGPAPGGDIRVALPVPAVADIERLSPLTNEQLAATLWSVHEPLLMPDATTLEPTPWLAQDFELSADGRTVTYRLRDDVLWHDGTHLTAADARFSLFAYRDDPAGDRRHLFALLDDAEALDDTTLRVTLLAPDVNWLLNASTQPIFQRAQYADYWQSQPVGARTLSGFDWSATLPIGTGPWQYAAVEEGNVTLDAFPDYWGGPPVAERLSFLALPDADERQAAWREGDVDLIAQASADDLQALASETGRAVLVDAPLVYLAAFNFDHPGRRDPHLLVNADLRQALSLALDRQRYRDVVFRGAHHADRAGTVAQPWAYDPALVTPPFDQARAESLLQSAGFTGSPTEGWTHTETGESLELTMLHSETSPPQLAALLAEVRNDLEALGIPTTVEAPPDDAFATRWRESRDWDLMGLGYRLFPGFTDMDLYGSAWDVRTNPFGFNPGGYRNAEADLAIQEWLTARADDLTAQRTALGALQRAVDEDLFGLWLGHGQEIVILRPELVGYTPHRSDLLHSLPTVGHLTGGE